MTTHIIPASSTHSKRIDTALAVLRALVGVIFLAHGAQKLFVFGLAGVSGGFAQMGIPSPELVAPLIAFLEFFGGIALMVGALTRLASLGLALDMLGATLLVHLKAGFFNPNGVEFPLLLLGATIALALTGAGAFSVDALLARRRRSRTAVAAVPTDDARRAA
ncbi:MAG TPA: DoxX family protein [Gemmatimonadaceae bacterium]|nr:DoxX family protein [Gemmatimonadaceae bacterium]